MPAPPGYSECDTRYLAAHNHPVSLIDLALSRNIDSHRLFRGTGLFYEDILTGQCRISPKQYLSLINNASRLLNADDSSFLFGRRLLPGHQGAAGNALRHAATLQAALECLQRFRIFLTPLLTPRLWLDDNHAWLYWNDTYGAGENLTFLIEASMTAVVGMCRELSGERPPWQFFFIHDQPTHVEQYWVHLGEDVHFGQPMNLMRMPIEKLDTPWINSSLTAGLVALNESEARLKALGFAGSFLDGIYEHLHMHMHAGDAPTLEQTALAFQMSPATLKRKLQKHGTSFQAQLDLVRKHIALYLYWIKRYSNEEVARFLRFHDAANFRRSFKRWTGILPSTLRQFLMD